MRSPASGCWYRRIARSGPGRARWKTTPAEQRPAYDPTCYLCPGNQRAGGIRTPDYTSTFVFDNDFAALLPDTAERALARTLDDHPGPALLRAESERGICRVVCFSPRHDLTLAGMDTVESASGRRYLGRSVR